PPLYFAFRHRGQGTKHRRPSGFSTVPSSIADAVALMDRLPDLHGHLGVARGVRHRLVLDAERSNRLHELGHLASDLAPVAHAHATLREEANARMASPSLWAPRAGETSEVLTPITLA